MKVKTDLFYEDWCENKEERCYYHDQSSFNQTKICNDKVLTVPGLVIYDQKRLHSTTQSVTLHYDVCSGGTTKIDIVQFLQEAREKKSTKLKGQNKPLPPGPIPTTIIIITTSFIWVFP